MKMASLNDLSTSPIVARFRPELLESLAWFHSLEGGLQYDKKMIEGVFLGKAGGARECIEGRVAIVRLHRAKTNNETQGQRVAWARKTMDLQLPVGLIMDKTHPKFEECAIDLPGECDLALMGRWQLVEIFIEWQDGERYLVGKFVKLSDQGIWWRCPGDQLSFSTAVPELRTCGTCGKDCTVKYYDEEAWYCGNHDCSLNDSPSEDQPVCDYTFTDVYRSQAFPPTISLPDPPRSFPEHLPKIPQSMTYDEMKTMMAGNKKARPFWEGWLCAVCNKLNQRIYWSRLECSNCHSILPISPCNMPFDKALEGPYGNITDGDEIKEIWYDSKAVTEERLDDQHSRVHRFTLHNDCQIILSIPKQSAVSAERGPRQWHDDIERVSRDGTMELKRFVFKGNKKAGLVGLRTKWFGANYGANYDNKMIMGTTPLDQAPPVISEVLAHITHTVGRFGTIPANFNEVLAVSYLSNMDMGFHSDSENSLRGDYVASYSTGDRAIMKFGLKKDLYSGKKKNGNLDPHLEVCRGSFAYDERRELQEKYKADELSKDEYELAVEDLYKNKNTKPRHARSDPLVLLIFPIPGTGAVVIQKGRVNDYYEHAVESNGIRYVMTAREVEVDDNFEELNEEEELRRQKGTVTVGEVSDAED